MSLNATSRRRWLGGLALLAAAALLICGETFLKTRLAGVAFLIYWLACFGFTGLAILMAFLDVRALQTRTRQEQLDLLEGTLKRLEAEARKQNPKSEGRGPK